MFFAMAEMTKANNLKMKNYNEGDNFWRIQIFLD